MLQNYFTIALRNLRRNKLFSLINILGLAIGISASLVIFLVVRYEFSVNSFHQNGPHIYRVLSKIEFPGLVIHSSGVPVPTAQAARNEITGLKHVSHFIKPHSTSVSIAAQGNNAPLQIKHQKKILFADPDYFNIIRYEWVAGSPAHSLAQPYQVVLSQKRAKTYFGNLPLQNLLGKQIIYNDSITATVTGIVKDFEQPTHFVFEEFISRQTIESARLQDFWSWNEWGSINDNSQMLLELAPGTSPSSVEKQLATLRNKYRQKNIEGKADKDDTQHLLQPLRNMHFDTEYSAFDQRQAHKPTLYGLLAVAGFLLLLGCINFINLTTAQSVKRAKEIGIRKTIGSSKKQLVVQFLSETLVLTLAASFLSIIITPLLLKVFSDFIPPQVTYPSLHQWQVWCFLAGLTLAISLLAGFYPAVVLTGFKPTLALKNQASESSRQSRTSWLRKTLTVSQFMIAQFLLIATLVVSKQIHYSLNMDLGFKKEAIVYFETPMDFKRLDNDPRTTALLQKIKAINGIENISLSGDAPASSSTSSTSMSFNDGKKEVTVMVEVKNADSAYFGLYKMPLVAGKNLRQSDTTMEFVINETLARVMGFANPADAVGKTLERGFQVPIVGVVADFHTKGTQSSIKPLAFSSQAARSRVFHLALPPQGAHSGQWKNTLTKVEKAYKEIYPGEDFESRFFDESIAAFYKSEQDISSLLKWAAGLCVFISCLGLLGLVIYTTNSRTKEIGVRKVLGASVGSLVRLLTKDFVALVLTAFVIAAPVAWWVMQGWLQDFAYRTNISWWVLALSGGGMVVVALLTLGAQTIKSAMANPVKSLRVE